VPNGQWGRRLLRLSIVVPVYKTERYLHKCIDSILGQTLTDFELILVDDGSPDRCPAICDEYARADRRVRVVHLANGGQGLARQIGVRESTGEYVGFVDSDDWIEPRMYEILCQTAVKWRADLVVCDWIYHDAESRRIAAYTQPESITPNYLYRSVEVQENIRVKILLEEMHCSPCNKLFRRQLLTECDLDRTVGLPNMQDWVLNCEYAKRMQSMIYLDAALYNYLVHSSGSLRGQHKDYLSVILRLHQLRLAYLTEFGFDHRDDLRRKCVQRFLGMALYAAYDYEFLFEGTTPKEKRKRIGAVLNNVEVRRCLAQESSLVVKSSFGQEIRWVLLRMRMPLLIYGFVKTLAIARRATRGLKKRCGLGDDDALRASEVETT
jgi:glycosyltransferase involved in cell wall biosynthesis